MLCDTTLFTEDLSLPEKGKLRRLKDNPYKNIRPCTKKIPFQTEKKFDRQKCFTIRVDTIFFCFAGIHELSKNAYACMSYSWKKLGHFICSHSSYSVTLTVWEILKYWSTNRGTGKNWIPYIKQSNSTLYSAPVSDLSLSNSRLELSISIIILVLLRWERTAESNV